MRRPGKRIFQTNENRKIKSPQGGNKFDILEEGKKIHAAKKRGGKDTQRPGPVGL